MSTIFTHPIVPLALGLGLGRKTVPLKFVLLGCLFSILPDLDVIGFQLGISYSSPWGHRGFTHSIVFAVLCAALATYAYRQYSPDVIPIFVFLAISMISHGVLDAMTFGGHGVGFFWPFTNAREFFPWRPLPVSTIGIKRFFNHWGMYVFKAEVYRVWIPMAGVMLLIWLGRVVGKRARS